MNAAERDQLLVRLDERTANTYKLVEKQESHLAELNEKVAKNATSVAVVSNKVNDMDTNPRFSRKQKAVGGTGAATIIVLILFELAKVMGWL